MKPTPEQATFVEAVANSSNSLVLQAVAGSGKTTAITLAAAGAGPSLALAFNARIKEELSRRLPANTEARTLNSLGHGTWAKHTGRRLQVDPRKIGALVSEELPKEQRDSWATIVSLVDKARIAGIIPRSTPGLCKGLLPDELETWASLCDEYDLDAAEGEIETARRVLARSIRAGASGIIDFNDQIYLPVVFLSSFKHYPTLFVDEAQDLSPIQHEIVSRSASRIIAVGDPNQAIYGWRGAVADSMDQLERRFSSKRLPLTVNFRCGRSIIAVAQQSVPEICAWEGAPEGEVRTLAGWSEKTVGPGSVILCRNNAPLVKTAFALLRRNVPVQLLGRDIGQGLKALISRLGGDSLQDFWHKLSVWQDVETYNARLRGNDSKADRILDRAESLRIIGASSGAKTLSELSRGVDKLFENKEARVTLSTIHKAKGLEWNTVLFLDSWRIPSKWAKTSEALQQEKNLRYVGVTRAKERLLFVDTDNFGVE